MIVEIGEKTVIVKKISTHIDARDIIDTINNIFEQRSVKMVYSFEGSPGPMGEGMIIRIVFDRRLSSIDKNTLKKVFKLRGILVRELTAQS